MLSYVRLGSFKLHQEVILQSSPFLLLLLPLETGRLARHGDADVAALAAHDAGAARRRLPARRARRRVARHRAHLDQLAVLARKVLPQRVLVLEEVVGHSDGVGLPGRALVLDPAAFVDAPDRQGQENKYEDSQQDY